ncbi:tripartite tricarboxylate transporter permease [Nocardioides sp. LHG3406-4]|uniref:tripartite tricarboxylate transporter permease n=1 Tax=Nocardioides sp. LHG3406-4 TaxID=2804575 RepID=UPI003CFAF743
MLDALVQALGDIFSFGPLLGMLIVLPIALISGLTPGGALPVSAVILSLAGVLDPYIAAVVIVFNNAASDITKPITSILMGIPGDRSSQATVLDGYPMARRGEAGIAIGASYSVSLVGGLFGALVLLASLPLARTIIPAFGSPEFFLLSLLGIVSVAALSTGAMSKGMLAAAFGILLATVGLAPTGGAVRGDFGSSYLFDGFELVPIVIGLFALPELIEMAVAKTSISGRDAQRSLAESKAQVREGMRIGLSHKWLLLRSSFIGTAVGLMPGVGGSAAHWIAYSSARATVKDGKKTFGKGDVRGVIAAESSNNSSDGGVLIPTLVFGLPGSGGTAILLSVLIVGGYTPGPDMVGVNLDVTMGMLLALVLGNIVVVPIMLYAGPWITRLTDVRAELLAAPLIAIVLLSAFTTTYDMADFFVVIAFTVLGLFMKRYGWPRPPILLAIVLTPLLEKYMNIAFATYGWSMLQRPAFLGILTVFAVGAVLSRLVNRVKSRTIEDTALAGATTVPLTTDLSPSEVEKK